MNQKRQRAASAIALLLVFSLSQVYVHANLAGKSLATKAAAPAPARAGKLTTRGNNPIIVNGNRTTPGTTILSGSQLLTPEGVGASVQFGRTSVLRMAPETSLTINFSDSSIDVILNSGYATLTTDGGVKGSLTTPDGKTKFTDAAGSTVAGRTGQSDDKDKDDDDKKKGGAVLGSGAESGGVLGGISNTAAAAFGVIVIGGAVAAAIIESNGGGDALRGINPSTGRP
jgi:hypothetical protein